jgi:serine/threonine-protein kinase HipA
LPINFDGVPLRGDKVQNFFDNLLPDSEPIRQRIRSRFGVPTTQAFDLLAAIGRDCVGAIQLLAEDETPADVFSIHASALQESAIERLLQAAGSSQPFALRAGAEDDDDAFRISIAGAQEKTALTWHRGRFCMPRGSTPTTHIFKLPLGLVGGRQLDMRHSLENEWLCAQLLAAYGLPVASCEVRQFGAARALVVERFDRLLHPSKRYWLRLPQEDMCQALGAPSALKYESDGGPGLVDIARVLGGSHARERDLGTLLRAKLWFWLLAATDGHAKNFSIRMLRGGRFELTPLYDVLSAWPVVGRGQNQLHPKQLKLALALRGTHKHYRLAEIERRHWNAAAKACGFGLDMEALISEVIETAPRAIELVGAKLPRGFPEQLFDVITSGVLKSLARLASVPKHRGE